MHAAEGNRRHRVQAALGGVAEQTMTAEDWTINRHQHIEYFPGDEYRSPNSVALVIADWPEQPAPATHGSRQIRAYPEASGRDQLYGALTQYRDLMSRKWCQSHDPARSTRSTRGPSSSANDRAFRRLADDGRHFTDPAVRFAEVVVAIVNAAPVVIFSVAQQTGQRRSRPGERRAAQCRCGRLPPGSALPFLRGTAGTIPTGHRPPGCRRRRSDPAGRGTGRGPTSARDHRAAPE